ncbi:FAD/fmn-containing protein [Fusarium sporotrichioides]|uniref:FAD/fmn-containing protein n=1 Tax=Fusarium sporotrichioides TaxID=5514 RepID=A0A395RS99_FUSSP|nr:FAD/fmn-containing protein [Fusarium sporotrichioides]
MIVPITIWLTFGLFLFHPSPASAKAPYCLPNDSCFPSTHILQAFNASVSGRLLHTQPYGAACYHETYDEATCQRLSTNKAQAQWRVEQPAQYPNMELDSHGNGCAIPDLQHNGSAPLPVEGKCEIGAMSHFLINATNVEDVAKSVRFAARYNLRFRVKNTGHCFTGRSLGEGSFSVWTHNMRDIEVQKGFVPYGGKSTPQDVFIVGPGVSVAELYRAAAANGFAVVGGLSPTVGATGGWILGGGVGPFARHFGMGVDNVVQFQVVTSSGAFAVVTKLWIKAHSAMKAINSVVGTIQCRDKGSFVALIHELVEMQSVIDEAGHSGAFSTVPDENMAAVLSFGMYTNNDTVKSADDALSLYDPLKNIQGCTPKLQALQTKGSNSWVGSYDKVVLPLVEESVPVGHSLATLSRIISEDLFRNDTSRNNIKRFISELPIPMIWQNTVSGAVNSISTDATSIHPEWRNAFAFVDISFFGDWKSLSNETFALMHSTSKLLTDTFGTAVYYNEQYATGEEWQHSQFGTNYERLLDIKRKVDPIGLLQCRNCVGSEAGY